MKQTMCLGAIALTLLGGSTVGARAQDPHAGHHSGKSAPAKKSQKPASADKMKMDCDCPCMKMMKEGGMMGKGMMGKGMMGGGMMHHGEGAKQPPTKPEAPKDAPK